MQPPVRPIRADNNQSDSFNTRATIGGPDKKLSAISQSQALTLPTTVSFNSQGNNHRSHSHLSSWVQAGASVGRALNPTSIFNTNGPYLYTPSAPVQVTAQDVALSHPAFQSSQRTQKGEMLAGNNFYPFDRELLFERERCNAALWHLNSTEPNKDGMPEDHLRLFRDILQGYVGEDSVVALPFTCDYGYNITIGKDVSIARNCRILDCALVKIGDRCVIGPNVSIITMTAPIDPKKRIGSSGPKQGEPIVIEDDCIIGANVTILPGRTVNRGSTVAACSVVTRVSLGIHSYFLHTVE